MNHDRALFDLATSLIDIPSISGDERGVIDTVAAWCESRGFRVELQEVEPGRQNLLATAGQPTVLLSTHLDTVPPFIPAREDDEWIHGRGSCDAKGIAAAMMFAADQARADGLPAALLFVVAEETDSIGAKQANRWLEGRGFRWLINGEPTDSTFVSASKGSMTVEARFEGRAAHSAYPERGDSAILHMTGAIGEIAAKRWGHSDDLGETTANVGVVRGGEKPNIIPASAEIEMMFRTTVPRERILAELQVIVARHNGRITRTFGNEPTRMHVPPGRPSRVVAFNTDVPHLGAIGTPLLYGPGSILDAHGEHERVGKADLAESVRVYRSLIEELEGKQN